MHSIQNSRQIINHGKGTDYTYTAAGRLLTRTWARGITTTYGYTHGLMTRTDYSDDTPDVTITYDSLGRQQSVSTGVAKSEFTYDPATLAQDTEIISYNLDGVASYEFTRVLDRSQDSLLRPTGWLLKDGTTIENQAAYAYGTTDGRLASVSGGGLQPPSQFNYTYLANSNLIQSVTATAGAVHTVTNTYEQNRNVLASKQNKVGTTVVSQYDYTVNAIGQRTNLATSGSAFANAPSWLWGYDSLGQVISADSNVNTSDRAYQYDTIGNRLQSGAGVSPAAITTYTANALNQYSQISNSQILNPSYDDDGNATAYPLPAAPTTNSTLAWDAENRLLETTVGTSGPLVRYSYDSQSRRIAKTVGTTTTVYVYDAWNCIAEYQGSVGVSPALSKSYTWGIDLSGSFQGAGGVGGLLCESQISNSQISNYFPTYDGNGNVSEYLDNAGAVTAHFEYDPFGRTVVDTDSSGLFAHRFSTKPIDTQTGLYYYGYRYYDPLTGRWPSRDPIEEKGGMNLYGYVGNDGMDGWDLLGEYPALENNTKPGRPVAADGEVQMRYTTQSELKITPCKLGSAQIIWASSARGLVSGLLGIDKAAENHEMHHYDGFKDAWDKFLSSAEKRYFYRCMCEKKAKCFNAITPSIGLLAYLQGTITAGILHLHGGARNGEPIDPYSADEIRLMHIEDKLAQTRRVFDALMEEVKQSMTKCDEIKE